MSHPGRRVLPLAVSFSLVLAGCLALLVLALGGRAAGAASSSRAAAHAASANVSGAVRAIVTARRDAGGAAHSIDHEGGGRWKVDLVPATGRTRERLISPNGRQVLRRSTKGRPRDAAQARNSRVGLATAVRTAARRGRGRLEGADPDRERGQNVWSVIFLRGEFETEVYVNSSSGQIIKVESGD